MDVACKSKHLAIRWRLQELGFPGWDISGLSRMVETICPVIETLTGGDGYASAITNFGFIANAVLGTADAIKAMEAGRTKRAA